MVYVGETKRSFETRKKEHIRGIRNAHSKPANIKNNHSTTALCKHASRRRLMGAVGEAPSCRRLGVGGQKPSAAGGTGVWGRSPQHTKVLHFFWKNNLILGLF